MVNISYINPLSNEGRQILKDFTELDTIFDINEDLISQISHTDKQKISDDDIIPKSIGDLAIKKILWAIEKKYNKNFHHSEFEYLFNDEILKEDVISFHILCQAIAIQFNLNSRETNLFIESQGKLIEERLSKISPSIRTEIINESLGELMYDGTISWKDIKDILGNNKISLRDLYIDEGQVILEKEEFLLIFGDEFKNRSPDMMFDILVGESVKESILSNILMKNIKEYITRIKNMSKQIEFHPAIEELALKLKDFIPNEISNYSSFYSGSGGIYGSVKAGKLNPEAFPPCIANTIAGVSSGGRNDAIVLLLTSFVSYARLYPRIFSSQELVKVSDIDTDLNITKEEILPLIYEAADNCTPPLFDDQPQEKLNIISKLGFGLHSEINIENEGETKWYTPMSCEKIKIHLPQLCKPDKSCKGLNNPLSCYGRKKYQLDNK